MRKLVKITWQAAAWNGLMTLMLAVAEAAAPPAASPAAPPVAPRAVNAIDLTGYWVAVVTEDWRWRMVTPAKGDYAGVPLNPEGRRVAGTWEPASDGSCLAYGAAALLRMPTRVHITWESDNVLKLETDAGQQVRRLVFEAPAPDSMRTLQGFSRASWVADFPKSSPIFPAAPPPPPGPNVHRSTLHVTTTGLSGGWLRKNGVPYSQDATVTEYFDRFASPNGDEWMMVTTLVDDPKYLSERFIVSSHFKREPNNAKWHPTACKG